MNEKIVVLLVRIEFCTAVKTIKATLSNVIKSHKHKIEQKQLNVGEYT
jgi:hypothetical protein